MEDEDQAEFPLFGLGLVAQREEVEAAAPTLAHRSLATCFFFLFLPLLLLLSSIPTKRVQGQPERGLGREGTHASCKMPPVAIVRGDSPMLLMIAAPALVGLEICIALPMILRLQKTTKYPHPTHARP